MKYKSCQIQHFIIFVPVNGQKVNNFSFKILFVLFQGNSVSEAPVAIDNIDNLEVKPSEISDNFVAKQGANEN